MRQRIHEQLNAAIHQEGLSLPVVLAKSKLKMTRATLWKKLCGDLPMKTEEAERITDTLREHGVNVAIIWPPRAPKRAA